MWLLVQRLWSFCENWSGRSYLGGLEGKCLAQMIVLTCVTALELHCFVINGPVLPCSPRDMSCKEKGRMGHTHGDEVKGHARTQEESDCKKM